MLNPPLIIPVERTKVYPNDIINLNLHYKMGGGLESVKARVEKIRREI
jgi:predicted RNA methylase